MAASNGNGLIAVATSIAPTMARRDAGRALPEYQSLCIQSWIENGFRIVSVNDPDEIRELSALYPDVEFVAVRRNASEWTGRKNPYIADLLAALLEANEPVLGIINSDLLFEPSAAWSERLPSLVSSSMVVAHRYNVGSLSGGLLRQYYGLDCFFFDKTTASRILEDAMPYAMGVPWWDCWLPCMALLNQRDVIVIDRPAVVHLAHDQAYSARAWREFAQIFSRSMIRGVENAAPAIPAVMTDLLPLFRKIEARASEGKKLGTITAEFGTMFISHIRAKAVNWAPDTTPSDPERAKLAGIFARFEERAAAGHALRKGRELAAAGKWSEIGPEVAAALAQVPEDADAVLMLGEISFHCGNLDSAKAQMTEAAKLAPDAAFPLHMLGSILARRGSNQQALDCYRQALARDPAYQPAYTAAGKLLWHTGARGEALAFLEQAVADHPHFSAAAELCVTYRMQLEQGIRGRILRFLKSIRSSFGVKRPSGMVL
jgi:tetratricopeptide (TPR) repeat protein